MANRDISALLMGILADARTANNAKEPEIMSKFQPYPQFNPVNPDFSDRRNEPWPIYPGISTQEYGDMNKKYSPTPETVSNVQMPWTQAEPSVTPLANQLGMQDILNMQRIRQLLGPG
ncbi:MAG TPA: hypothetical protein VIE65_16320 [Methylobacter sp.]|jgi:hypothetical protein